MVEGERGSRQGCALWRRRSRLFFDFFLIFGNVHMAFVYRRKLPREGWCWVKSRDLPDVCYADEYGLLAYGGEYSGDCFEAAYRRGIFPWPSGEMEAFWGYIPWFCPDPRFVLYAESLHISHSLKQTLRKKRFEVYADRAFDEVVHACATVRRRDQGTWITRGMERAFGELFERGIAHSVECYENGKLVGGFYGTNLGQVFGGESMFTCVSDATKVAFVTFVRRGLRFGLKLIDCQCYTDNMARYGAREIPRSEFLKTFENLKENPLDSAFWSGEWTSQEG